MISIIVLAAGKSTRFGANKLLSDVQGVSMIRRVVAEAVASAADETVVVLGFEAERVKAELLGIGCRFVLNEGFEVGQSSSVKKGVEAVSDHAEAALILPGDVAFISSGVIDKVIEGYRNSGAPIVVASHGRRSGHPILFQRSVFPDIMDIDEKGKGLKRVTTKYPSRIKRVEVGSDAILQDVDTEKDLLKYTSGRDRIKT
ncbi:MAG TPA: nucleotidyltransferase family protein [Candidatus Bathyarchaeia archaeon]|nr:nucleotidyltransferase family protein [Candidatus Bathyarchaeia archaeon]